MKHSLELELAFLCIAHRSVRHFLYIPTPTFFFLYINCAREFCPRTASIRFRKHRERRLRAATAAVLLAAAASPRSHVPKPKTRGGMRRARVANNSLNHKPLFVFVFVVHNRTRTRVVEPRETRASTTPRRFRFVPRARKTRGGSSVSRRFVSHSRRSAPSTPPKVFSPLYAMYRNPSSSLCSS